MNNTISRRFKHRRWVLKRNGKYMVSLVDEDTNNLFEATQFNFKHPDINNYRAVEIQVKEK